MKHVALLLLIIVVFHCVPLAAQQPPPPPPRKPRRQAAKPNLSQAALAGATPLGTFAELAAFWEAKKKEVEPAPAAAQPPAPDQGAGEAQPPRPE